MSAEKETYVRRRAFNKIHVTSWLIYLEKDGFVRCPFQNCNFMAFDVNEMCDHYGFCKGDSSFAKYVCEVCKGCTNSEKRLQEHRSRAHNITVLPEQADPTIEIDQGDPGKPSRVLMLSWGFFFDKHKYIKCSNCQYIANTMSDMCRHYLVCKQEKKFLRYVCPECKGRAQEVVGLLQHLERAHKISRRPDQFNHISRNMVQFWEKELREEKYATCLHINNNKERDCGYIDVDLLGINEHSQTCKGPKSVDSSNQCICEFCQKWTNSSDKLTRHQILTHNNKYSAELDTSDQSKHTKSILQTVKPEVITDRENFTAEQSNSTKNIEAFQGREVIRKEANHQPFEKVFINNIGSSLKENSPEYSKMSPTKYLAKRCNGEKNESSTSEISIPKEGNEFSKNVANRKSIVIEEHSFSAVTSPVQGSQEIFLDLVEDKLVPRKIDGEIEEKIDLKNNTSRGKTFQRQESTLQIINENQPIEIVDLRDVELLSDQPVCKSEGKINLESKTKKDEFKYEDKCDQSIKVENLPIIGWTGDNAPSLNIEHFSSNSDYQISQQLFGEEAELIEENLFLGKELDKKSQKKSKCHFSNGGDNNYNIHKTSKEPSYVLFKEGLSSDEEDTAVNRERGIRTEDDIKLSFDSIPQHRTFNNKSPRSYSRRKSHDDKVEGLSPTKPINTLINENSPPALLDLTEDLEEVKRTDVSSFKGKKSYENLYKSRTKAKNTAVFQNRIHDMCDLQKEESKNSEKNDKLMVADKADSFIKQTVSKESYSVTKTSKTFDNNFCSLIMSADDIVGIENDVRQDPHKTTETKLNTEELILNESSSENLEILSNISLIGSQENGKKEDNSRESCNSSKHQDEKSDLSIINLVQSKNNKINLKIDDEIDYLEPKKVSFFYNGKLNSNTPQIKKSSNDSQPSEDKSNFLNHKKLLMAESFSTGNQFVGNSQNDSNKEENIEIKVLKESESSIPIVGNTVDSLKLDLANSICSDFEIDGSADGTKTAMSPSRIEVDITAGSFKTIEKNLITKPDLQWATSDFREERSDEDFLGADEEQDMKKQFFNGFQEIPENVQSKSKRFHQFLNRLSESENEEWYVNAGNLSMEVRKDLNLKINYEHESSVGLDEEMTVIVVEGDSSSKDLFVRPQEEFVVTDSESKLIDNNETKNIADFVDLKLKNNKIKDVLKEKKSYLIKVTEKDLQLEDSLKDISPPSSIESKPIESLKVSLNIDLLNIQPITKTNINGDAKTLEEVLLKSKTTKMCLGVGESKSEFYNEHCETDGPVVCSTPLKFDETLTQSSTVSCNTSSVKDKTSLNVETSYSDDEPLSDVQKTCRSSVKAVLSSKELLTEGFSPHYQDEEENINGEKKRNFDTHTLLIQSANTANAIVKNRGRKPKRIDIEMIDEKCLNSSNSKSRGKSAQSDLVKEISSKSDIGICDTSQSVHKSSVTLPSQNNTFFQGNSSTPKKRGRPPKKKNDLITNSCKLKIEDTSGDELLVSIFSEEVINLLDSGLVRTKEDQNFQDDLPHEYSCSDSDFHRSESRSCQKYDEPQNNTVTCNSIEIKVPKKRGRKRKQNNVTTIGSLGDEIHENKVIKNNDVVKDLSSEKSCDISTLRIPKKRGRKPKQSNITINSSFGDEIEKDIVIKNDDKESQSYNISTVTVPKKRGRKPKLQLGSDTSADCNLVPENSVTKPLQDNSRSTDFEESNNQDKIVVKIPKKRGRPAKTKPQNDLLTNSGSHNESSVVESKVDTINNYVTSASEEVKEETSNSLPYKTDLKSEDCDKDVVLNIRGRKLGRKRKLDFVANETTSEVNSITGVDSNTPKSELLDTDVILINEEKLNNSQTPNKKFKKCRTKSKKFQASDDDDTDRYEPDKIESEEDAARDKRPQKKRRKVELDKKQTKQKPASKNFFNTKYQCDDKIVCGACKQEMTYAAYKHHHAIFKHYMIAWIEGEEPVDMSCQKDVENRLWFAKKRLGKTPFRCPICKLPKLSAVGFYSHIRFCGKDVQEKESLLVTCEICGAKLMPSSMKPHIYMKHSDRSLAPQSKITVTEQTVVGRSPRAAAARAVQVMQQNQDLEDPELRPNSPEKKSHLSHLYVRPNRVIPAAEYRRWKELFASTGTAHCTRPGCHFSTEMSIEIRKHYFTCPHAPPRPFKCRLCSFTSLEEEPMVGHVEEKHDNTMFTQLAESEESTDESDSEQKSNDRPSRPIFFGSNLPFKFLKYVRFRHSGSHLLKRKYFSAAIKWTLDLRKERFSSRTLYPEAQPQTHLQPLTAETVARHLPELAESMRFRGKNAGDWQKLSRFQACLLDGGAVLFSGGPVWATAWAPVPHPEENQYLAVVSHTFVEHTHKMASLYNYPGLIQIWSLGPLPNIGDVKPNTPRLVVGLAQQRGPVWDLAWCPAGAYTQERLGLLAAACGDGCIVVYAVPRVTEDSGTHFLSVKPTWELKLGCEMTSQCTCIDWHSADPHSVIAGGFANGMVALWDLTTTSCLLKQDSTILPFKVIEAHHSATTAVQMSCTKENIYMMTASLDRETKFWRIDDTTSPVCLLRKACVTDAVMPSHWPLSISAYDDVYSINNSHVTCCNYRDTFMAGTSNIIQQPGTVWGLSFNDWLNGCACASEMGRIKAIFRQQLLVSEDSKKTNKSTVIENMLYCSALSVRDGSPVTRDFGTSYKDCASSIGLEFSFDNKNMKEPKSSCSSDNMNSFPIRSFNTVSWNPNMSSFTWLATGMQCGLLVLTQVKDVPPEDLSVISQHKEPL